MWSVLAFNYPINLVLSIIVYLRVAPKGFGRACSKLISSEDPHDVDEQSILEIILESLCYDPIKSVFAKMVLDFIC